MYCEDDALLYCRRFLCLSIRLVHMGHLTEEERDTTFCDNDNFIPSWSHKQRFVPPSVASDTETRTVHGNLELPSPSTPDHQLSSSFSLLASEFQLASAHLATDDQPEPTSAS